VYQPLSASFISRGATVLQPSYPTGALKSVSRPGQKVGTGDQGAAFAHIPWDPDNTVRFDGMEDVATADLDLNAGIQDHPMSLASGADDSMPLPYGEPLVVQSSAESQFAPVRPDAPFVPAPGIPAPLANDPPVASPPSASKEPYPPHAATATVQGQPEPAAARVREIVAGTVLRDRYVIEHVIGIGGNSLVFQAVDKHRDSVEDAGGRVALKVLRPQLRGNPYALMRMRREFRQMQRLTHNGIARVFDLDCDDDLWFMTLERVEGQTITQWMKGSASDAEAMQIITGCCEAVSYAHSRGIVHGDLKPSNVLVMPGMGIKLVDFGSAAAETGGAAIAVSARSFAATPPYASPQILTGNLADPRDDVFSLACIAYAVLTRGEHPFERKSSLDAYRDQMRPTYSPRIQPRVFDVIVRGLSWQRPNRPASASEFLSALIGNDLSRDPRPTSATAPASTFQAPAMVSAVIAPEATDGVLPHSAVQSVPVTLDIAQSRRQMLPAQWLAIQPWSGVTEWSSIRSVIETPACEPPAFDGLYRVDSTLQWINPAVIFASAPLVQVTRPEPETIEGELLMRAPTMAPVAVRATQHSFGPHPSIWHRHGLAAVAVIGVLAILLGHKTEVGSSTTAANLTQVQATPVTTTAAAIPVAIRETTEQSHAPAEPNIVEHVVPPPPAAPGFVSFETAAVQVGSNQSMAVLTLKRLDSTRGRARIAWTIEGASGRTVVDSNAINSQTVQFLDGQEVRSLYIPLLTPEDPGVHQPTRTFTVKLKKLEGSPAIGPVTQAKVTIASGY
jgi:serine/threonine protein kinase